MRLLERALVATKALHWAGSSPTALYLPWQGGCAGHDGKELSGGPNLPPGSVLLTAAYSNGLVTQLSAKVRMPRTELDAFIAAAKFTTALTPGLRAVDAKHNVGGGNLWDPETAKTISGLDEEQPTAEGTRRALLVNLDAPDAVTVYLYASRG
ncbi:hypothetical protein ACGF3C_11050 [Micromonospora sp. NPDC047762]|uniref:hypothetical protein n=1 Tax=Micromonospora sp. NPDC047762 TaxID=3364255 RepID=UPI0037212673